MVDLLRQGILAVNEKILLEKNPPSLTASSSSSSSLSGSFSSEKTSHAKSISPLLSPEAVGALRHCIGHAMKCLLDYPGLTLRGILCEEFFSHFGNVPTLHPIPSSPSPFGMYKTWEQILNAQKKLEEGEYQKNEKKTDKKITWRGFNEKEIVFAKKIWEFYKYGKK